MDAGYGDLSAAGVLSVLHWWREAGVDVTVSEEPVNWLARAAPAAAPRPQREEKAPAQLLPDTLEAFRRWLAEGDDVPESKWGPVRVLPAGDPASELMVIGDAPERADAQAGQLYSGEAGELFDKMMKAIGRDRSTLYLAPIASIRPPGGRADEAATRRLAEIARHHIALVKPKRLLLMGETPARLLLGMDLRDARGGTRHVNHAAGMTEAIATYRPQFLIQRPAAKREAWKDLQLLREGLTA